MFDPFGKELKAVTASDLSVLKDIAEGWFVEYKRDRISPRDLAKSISAFANHNGGWLFLGITGGADNKPAAFGGCRSEDAPLLEQHLREAVDKHCSSPPYYERLFIHGPEASIGLQEGRFIALVRVPLSHDTPHIHSSGRIYRRTDSASEPKPELERGVLDALAHRRDKARAALDRFLSWRPKVSDGETWRVYCHLGLHPDPLQNGHAESRMGFEKYCEIMHDRARNGIPFDNVFTSSEGYVARQVMSNHDGQQLLTFRYYSDASARIAMPINTWDWPSNESERAKLEEQFENISPVLDVGKGRASPLMDLTELFFLMDGLLVMYRRLLDQDNVRTPLIAARVSITGVWRKIPFVDTPSFAKYVSSRGLPFIEEQEVQFPVQDPALQLDGHPKVQDASSFNRDSAAVFAGAIEALGVSFRHIASSFEELHDAFDRRRRILNALDDDRTAIH